MMQTNQKLVITQHSISDHQNDDGDLKMCPYRPGQELQRPNDCICRQAFQNFPFAYDGFHGFAFSPQEPLLKGQRCVILADGFYEWRRQEKEKQPFFIYFPQAHSCRAEERDPVNESAQASQAFVATPRDSAGCSSSSSSSASDGCVGLPL